MAMLHSSPRLDDVCQLLEKNSLPTNDLTAESMHQFWGVEKEGELVAAIGLETYEKIGLLRSLVVDDKYRGEFLAVKLIEQLIQEAKTQSILALYLITTTAEKYFLEKGFRPVLRKDVPQSIQSSREFSDLCPASATVMMYSFDGQ